MQSIIDNAVMWAENVKSNRLSEEVYSLNGMSGRKTRRFLNEVCRMVGDECTYLEAGTWRGSTLISAAFKNPNGIFYGVDNFSQFFRTGRTRRILHNTIRSFYPDINVMFVEADIHKVDMQIFPRINVFFFDANHAKEEHYKGILRFSKMFKKNVILIIDDWACKPARRGSRRAMREMPFKVVYERELEGNHRDDAEGWWNGLYVAHLRRRR